MNESDPQGVGRRLRAADRALVGALPKAPPAFLLTGLDPNGSLGVEAVARYPGSRVAWFHFDLFPASLASFQGLDAERIVVAPDLPYCADAALAPDDPVRPDVVALPFPKGGEALFAREMIEQAHDALVSGGRLLAATDGDPAWLKRVGREVFRNAEVTARPAGAVVICTRKRPEPAQSDHSHVARLKTHGRELAFRTRPGVFSYGHIDQGSKALLAAADLAGCRRVLDIGCGVGVLGIFAAATVPGCAAVLVDSNTRAVALARENAERNGAASVEVIASAEPLAIQAGAFDCVLANPPYYANFKIALRFIAAAHQKLEKGGRLWLVAKAVREHAERVEHVFGNAEVRMSAGYGVISAVR